MIRLIFFTGLIICDFIYLLWLGYLPFNKREDIVLWRRGLKWAGLLTGKNQVNFGYFDNLIKPGKGYDPEYQLEQPD